MRFTTLAQAPTIGAMTYLTYMTSAPHRSLCFQRLNQQPLWVRPL